MIYIKCSNIFLLLLCLFLPKLASANCKALYTKVEAFDMADDGKPFPIVSVYRIGSIYGDSSPINAILLKKSALPRAAQNLKNLTSQVRVMAGAETLYKQDLKQLASVKDQEDYILFTEFNSTSLKRQIYEPLNKASKLKEKGKPIKIKVPTGLLISVLHNSKQLCSQQLEIDFH